MSLAVGPEDKTEAYHQEGHTQNNKKIEKEVEEAKNTKQVPFLKLFSFADSWDYVLMFVGSIGACVHGASVPVFFIFFGKLINIIGIAYLFPTTVTDRVAKYALDFVYLAIVILFSSWTEVACWMHTGERQAAKMRLAYLRSLLDQDISMFDTEASTGEVINAITSDVLVVQDAISEKVIGNVRTVQAFVGEEKALMGYRNALVNTYKYGKRGGLAKGLGLGSLHCILFFSWALLTWFTSITVHKNIANGGDSFTTMLNVVISGLSLGLAAPNFSTFLRAKTAAYPIFEMIEKTPATKTSSNTGKTLASVDGHIEFHNVGFAYPSRPEVRIFENFNLDIPAGKIVALVGGSGSGKSTVISLIERFYEPTSGAIFLDGHDIKGLDLKWLRQQIGLVNQEPALFATSIRENMLYGKDDATLDELTRAAKLSGALTFINNLPDRYETQVGERGVQLSGGQKQRIAISRAILKNPSILLLDEATSALDAESERSVQEALDRVMLGRTTVVVAHRLSTVRNADKIAVVQGGKIMETGTHDQLMSDSHSVYSSLVKLQDAAAAVQESSQFANANVMHTQSIKYSREFSGRAMSTGSSFRVGGSFISDKDSVSRYHPDEIDQPKAKPVSMRRLYSMVGSDWIYGFFGTIGALMAGAQMPLFALGVTDALISYYMDWETTKREVKKISLLFCGGAVITVIVHVIEHLSFGIMGEKLTLRVREKMFRAMLQNEIGWFDESTHNSAILSSRLEADATLLKTIAVDRSAILLQNVGMIVTSFIIAFIINWRITLVVLATYPLMISGHISEKLFMKGFGGNLGKAYFKANMLAAEAVSNIRTVAAFCSEKKVIDMYERELVEPSKQSFRRGQAAGIFFGVSQFFLFSSYALALWYGSVLMGKELASFSSVMKAFMVLIVTALAMGETLAMAPDIIKGNQMAASVFEVLDRKTEIQSDVGEEILKVEGVIEMRGVEFYYPSRPDVIIFRNFNIKVKAGKSMALVGTSGSGKSTVLSLILRFYDPVAGIVMIDGKDIRKLRLKSLRKHVGLVQQEPALFATTIYENILYGKSDATESEVIEAAKLANAHSFISALPEGYSTKVGERGVQLSGGQKQRVAIARAMVKNPKILLLDEATSALDMESERVVQQALDRVMGGRTTVMVAHRLSTIKNADVISVLQNGKIIEQGSHNALVENTNGAYYKLIHLQQRTQE